jgi:hypothetical protein
VYVAVPEANLRDRVAAVYSKTGTAKMGEKLEVLDRQKRFVRVRTMRNEEGWIELRSLVTDDVFEAFQKLAEENRNILVQGHGVARATLNIHVTPSRVSDKLYQLTENEKVEILKRATGERVNPQQTAAKQPVLTPKPKPDAKASASVSDAKPAESAPKAYDDFWLVRNKEGHVGWVLARMIDLDVPVEVAQYAEGQRIQGAFVLNTVEDSEKGKQAQYLVLFSEPKDGLPYDFDQARVFSWNLKRHRYETAYRERNIVGSFPVKVTNEEFGAEGVMPVFYIRKKNEDGTVTERRYRLIGNIVRQVYAPGEEKQKAALARPKAEKSEKGSAKRGKNTHPKP